MSLVKKTAVVMALLVLGLAVLWGNVGYAYADTGVDWSAVQTDASDIYVQAQAIHAWAENVRVTAQQLAAVSTNPETVALAEEIIQLAGQTEQDATTIMVTARDINERIDHSEATTLRLSDDIGVMADRIGEMADRILWTELQIGVMADRIVESEYLISSSALTLSAQIKDSSDTMVATTYALMNTLNHMKGLIG